VNIRFVPVPFDEIRAEVRRHLAALPGTIDSFLEERILDSAHYRIAISDEKAGFASIHHERLITQFALDEPFRRYGQPIFARLRHWEQVREAFVPTFDSFYLGHALDDYRQLAQQAYLFVAAPTGSGQIGDTRCRLRPAEQSDIELIGRESGDFFAPIERYVAAQALFLTLRGDEPVGFGLLEVSALYDDVASIGMYTIERHRRAGVGTETIALLLAECRSRGLHPVAGCWYYNHRSKRTLECAGMVAPARLLRISY
jgi:GNAT superfamily N-acetyltransferase